MTAAGEAIREAAKAIADLQERVDGLTLSFELLKKKVDAIDARLPPPPASQE